MLEQGIGIAQDLDEALRWYRAAAAGGAPDAAARAAELEARLAAAPAAAPASPAAASPAAESPAAPGTVDAEMVQAIQVLLARLGFDPGTPDGRVGPRTTAAIKEYQRLTEKPATGEPSEALLRDLERLVQEPG